MIGSYFKHKIYLLFVVIAVISSAYIIGYFYDISLSQQQSNLLNSISANLISDDMISNDNNFMFPSDQSNESVENPVESLHEETSPKIIEKSERMIKIESLQSENADIIGWIEIPGTAINYPVLQGSDNSFYVNHNYKKQKTQSGSIFVDADYNWSIPSTNLLIYGHNMKNGTMFTSLVNYKSKKYYDAHPNIRFTTNSDDVTYEIIAAFESKVYSVSDTSSFKYYNFINARNEDEFNTFLFNIKQISLYDTGKTANYGDNLITLSTCAYHTKNGRFAVVGRKVLK